MQVEVIFTLRSYILSGPGNMAGDQGQSGDRSDPGTATYFIQFWVSFSVLSLPPEIRSSHGVEDLHVSRLIPNPGKETDQFLIILFTLTPVLKVVWIT